MKCFFLNHVEVGAQDAAYILLQMPLRKASRQFTFFNTNVENERVVLFKSHSVLKEMPKQSQAIEADNNIKRYQRRLGTMEKCCLAEYIANYIVKFSKEGETNKNLSTELPEENYDLDIVDGPYANEEEGEGDNVCDDDSKQEVHFGKDGSILYKRRVPHMIYSVGFNKEHDKETTTGN